MDCEIKHIRAEMELTAEVLRIVERIRIDASATSAFSRDTNHITARAGNNMITINPDNLGEDGKRILALLKDIPPKRQSPVLIRALTSSGFNKHDNEESLTKKITDIQTSLAAIGGLKETVPFEDLTNAAPAVANANRQAYCGR